MSHPTTDADVVGSQTPVREQDRRPEPAVRTPAGEGGGPSLGVWIVGLVLGVVILGLVVAFAVVLPRTSATAELDLPDTLPGGWTAADVVEERGDAGERLTGVSDAVEAADELLAGVYDDDTVVRAYVDEELTTFLTVVAFEAPGGAFAPEGLPGPDRTDVTLVREGDGTCLVHRDPANPDAEPGFTTCQVSLDGRTVQLGGPGTTADELVELARAVLEQAG